MKITNYSNQKLNQVKRYTGYMAILFFISAGIGVLINYLYPQMTANYLQQLMSEMSFIQNFNFSGFFLFIFFNNIIKVFLSIILGVFWGIISSFFVGVNGLVLGLVGAYNFPHLGIEGLFVSLFFHGIFELSAVFIGGGLGLLLGTSFYRQIVKEKNNNKSFTLKTLLQTKQLKDRLKNNELKRDFQLAIDGFVYLCIPLLLIAAIIESLLIVWGV